MFLEVIDTPVVLALTPVAGFLAFQRLWSRRRAHEDLRAEAHRAAEARAEAMRVMHDALVAAERAQRARDEFLARMSHELRTPLNAVIGFSRLLESNRAGNQRPEDLELLARVRANGEQLLRLLEDVLEHARIARGNLTMESAPTDVAAIARKIVAQHLEAAATRGVKLTHPVAASPAFVRLDPRRFEVVLKHLVENAIKFTPSGSVSVDLVTGEDGSPLRLTVSDTGIGIAPDRLEEIFEPFTQVEGSRERHYDGAGLGLPVSRQLCAAMGCHLTVVSDPGRGSRFTICFPPAS